MEKIIGKAVCIKFWTDGYFSFDKGEEVDLTYPHSEHFDYAIVTPFGGIDIDIDNKHFQLKEKINEK